MKSRIAAGALAGILGGIVFGVLMQVVTAPTPDGGRMPMMAMVAMVVGSQSLFVGWVYHLFNSAVIGALFGVVFDSKVSDSGSGAVWGAAWGVVWWVLGGLILMPVLLGMPVFAALRMPPMRPVAAASLVGHLAYGVITGVAYAKLRARELGAWGRRAEA